MDKDMSQYGHYEEGVYSDHYATHVSAMTAENLHGKSEIAAELAYRDARIQQLEARNAELEAQIEQNKKEMLAGLAHRDEYATSLEARNAELEAEVEKLREGYREAIDDIDSWGAYASNYFQQKHDLEGCIKMHEKALTAGEVD